MWFPKGVHEAVGPAEDRDRVGQVQDLQIGKARLTQRSEVFRVDGAGFARQLDAVVEDGLVAGGELSTSLVTVDRLDDISGACSM